MPHALRKLLRLVPPVFALAALGGVCLFEVDRIAVHSHGYQDKQVVLNEICAHNLSGLRDGNGAYGDWIELYNPCGGTIDLSGWTLTDDQEEPARWTFPAGTVLDEYLILFADGTDTVDPAGYLHTAFSLKTRGETLYLYDADGELVDHLKYPEQDFDITYGRAFGNGEDAGAFGTATPGAANPVNFLDENRGMVRTILNSNGKNVVLDVLGEQLERDLKNHLRSAVPSGAEPGPDPEFLAALYSGGVIHVAQWWLTKGSRMSKEQVVQQFSMLVQRL